MASDDEPPAGDDGGDTSPRRYRTIRGENGFMATMEIKGDGGKSADAVARTRGLGTWMSRGSIAQQLHKLQSPKRSMAAIANAVSVKHVLVTAGHARREKARFMRVIQTAPSNRTEKDLEFISKEVSSVCILAALYNCYVCLTFDIRSLHAFLHRFSFFSSSVRNSVNFSAVAC